MNTTRISKIEEKDEIVEKTNTSAMRFYERSGYSVFRDDGNRFLLKKEMEDLFCDALREKDTGKLLSVPKSDLHNHSTKGCRRAWLAEKEPARSSRAAGRTLGDAGVVPVCPETLLRWTGRCPPPLGRRVCGGKAEQNPALFGGTIHRPEFIFFRCRKSN